MRECLGKIKKVVKLSKTRYLQVITNLTPFNGIYNAFKGNADHVAKIREGKA